MTTLFDLALSVPEQQDRQVLIRMGVAVADGAAKEDHRVIQKGTITVRCSGHLLQVIGEQLGMIDVDLEYRHHTAAQRRPAARRI